MQQKRLLLALVISSAILFLWSFLYPVPTPKPQPEATQSPAASPSATQSSNSLTPTAQAASAPASNVSAAPQRTITVETPLYRVKFDTLGAEPVSWIIKANKNSHGQPEVYSVGGKRADKKPLELISPEGLSRQPRLVPLQVLTGDVNLDAALSSSTYRVEGIDQASGDVAVNLADGEKKELTFVFEDANRVQVRKKIVFDARSYATDLSL